MPLLASIPILVILVLMVGYRWGAARAGAAGYLAALFVAVVFFGAGADALAYAHVKGLILTFDVLFIVWAAFLLYRVADEAGAIKVIGQALPNLTADRGMQAILIGWVFASFLQGAGGFGVPVAVTAPLLVGLGFSPLTAVVVPSIGHGWAVTFGSLGSSFQALMSSTGLDQSVLAPGAALFLGISALVTGPMVAHSADGWSGVRRLTVKALILGVVMGAVQYAVAVAGLWNIAAFGGGLAGLLVSVPLARWGQTGNGSGTSTDGKKLFVALSAYFILVALTVVILLVPAVTNFMGQAAVRVQFPETVTSLGYVSPAGANRPVRIFTHAGAILLYTSIIAFFVYCRAGLCKVGAAKAILNDTVKKMMASSLSILEMVAMATVMQQAGMTEALAQGLAGAVGAAFPVIAPWIGGIGAFMTGSNTNSNVVFGALQMRTAELLSLSAPFILAGQTAGAALASVAAPTKVVVGASTAGMAGREGEVLRALLGYTVLLVLLISGLTLLAVWLF
ncbi:MAG: L-lactate permease [Chloroflexota bacterium]